METEFELAWRKAGWIKFLRRVYEAGLCFSVDIFQIHYKILGTTAVPRVKQGPLH